MDAVLGFMHPHPISSHVSPTPRCCFSLLRFCLPESEAAQIAKAFDRALESAAAALSEDHVSLSTLEADNAALVNTRGDLPPDAAAEYERRRKVRGGREAGGVGVLPCTARGVYGKAGAGAV